MKKWSLNFRVWHWLHAVVVLGLLGTVLLRKTFLSWRANSEILLNKLSGMGIEVSTDQAAILAKAVRAPMWEWHIILGYALSFFILYRAALFFTDSGRLNYLDFRSASLYKKMVKISYIGFYGVIVFMALSGLALHFHQELGLLKETTGSIKELHEAVYNLVLIFVVVHIAGVVVAESRDEKGLVSDMINGGKS